MDRTHHAAGSGRGGGDMWVWLANGGAGSQTWEAQEGTGNQGTAGEIPPVRPWDLSVLSVVSLNDKRKDNFSKRLLSTWL